MSELPGPAEKRGSSTSQSHDPGEDDSSCSVSSTELEASHGFADDNVSLYSQDDQ